MEKIEFKIRSSQTVFYAVGRRGWANYMNYVSDFTTFNAQYTTDYGTAALNDLDAAEKLPNVVQRRSNTKSLYRKTASAVVTVLKLWKKLNRYIVNAYTADQVEPMREAAGSNYYNSASGNNFNDAFTMFDMALVFMITNATTLAKKGKGMPDTFIDTFTTAKNAFNSSLTDYKAALTGSQQGTSAKLLANEAVNKVLMDMMNDGKEIYDGDADMVKLFNYSALEKMEDKSRKTGLHFMIKEEGSKKAVNTSTLFFYPQDEEAKPNKRGTAMVMLKEGVVSCTITTPGYETLQLTNLKVDKNVMHRHTVFLKKEVAAATQQTELHTVQK